MNLAKVFTRLLAGKAKAFEQDTANPLRAQETLLLDYLTRNQDTEYGKKNGFSAIKTIKDFQEKVPIIDSKTILPYVERMMKGENNILTKDKVIFFSSTSGTTGIPKKIPVTVFSKGKKADQMNIWSYYVAKDHPEVLDGKMLVIISPEIEGYTESGLVYGAESGHEYKFMPLVIKSLYALPYDVFEIKDYDARYYVILRLSMACENITNVVTLNPSTLTLLCHKIGLWHNMLLRDINDGTLNDGFDIPLDIRKKITAVIKPEPARAAALKRILDDNQELLPKHFWPKLELIECWKGGTVKLYLKELVKYFGNVPMRDLGCLSSEARSSVPMTDEGAGGVLAINTNFYEFVPKEDMGRADKRVLLCDELEIGKLYYLIVTTPGGLYRYNIDDIITVDGFFNKTPVIEFVQKGQNAISITGEKVYEYHVNQAVDIASEKMGIVLRFFTACVEPTDPARYVFLAEFEDTTIGADKKRRLLYSLDHELGEQNEEYLSLRKQGLLGAPVLKVVKKDSLERYKKMRLSQGVNDAQFKMPKLSRDFDFEKNFEIEEEIPLG